MQQIWKFQFQFDLSLIQLSPSFLLTKLSMCIMCVDFGLIMINEIDGPHKIELGTIGNAPVSFWQELL